MDPVFVPSLLKGMAIGLGIAAPVGPIGLLCIRRTLAFGPLTGIASGLGAASADAVYGAIAAFGLVAVMEFLLNGEKALRLIGGLFLLWMAWRTATAIPATAAASSTMAEGSPRRRLVSAWASTFALTFTNPATILSFIAVFSGLGLASTGNSNIGPAIALVLGVFLGSTGWWLALCGAVGGFATRITSEGMLWINRLSGAILAAFGITALLTLLWP